MGAVVIIMAHMLKWDAQPAFRGPSWSRSIATGRARVHRLLACHPSYRTRTAEALAAAYPAAKRLAVKETGISEDAFPTTMPYTWPEIMGGIGEPDQGKIDG